MSVTRARLTEADIRRLVKGDSADDRAAAAHKLCRSIEKVALTAEEREAAQDIIRVLAADATELVRRALAVTLKASPLLPRDTALKLARDVEAVALPIVNFSPAFTDDDLAEIVRAGSVAKQIAVASRDILSPAVTSVIAEVGAKPAVEIACANDNALFSERALDLVVDRFADSEDITKALAYRAVLPVSISERLVKLVSDTVREHLVARHSLRPETAMELAAAARERATVDLVEQAAVSTDIAEFVRHLARNRRLTPSLLLRALGRGQMPFFEHAVAELAGVAHQRTWLMIHDAGPLGLRAIYDRAGLPSRLFAAFRAGVDAYRSLQFDGGHRDRERFQERMIQRFLTAQPYAAKDDINYLLERLDRAPDVAAQANAA
ncbi:MAG: DUF2336 domain-containing protein [Caulobacteraceae bacterium]|nr:DUF2336 domain-containing protein [Caulobacteraceae bacterium]